MKALRRELGAAGGAARLSLGGPRKQHCREEPGVGGGENLGPVAREAKVATAWHEAGHPVLALELGGELTGPLSIRSRRQWRGIAFASVPGYDAADVDELDEGLPAALWPETVRRALELDVLLSLAAAAAEKLAPREFVDSGYLPENPLDIVAAAPEPAEALERLSDNDRRLLARGDATAPLPSDLQSAFEKCKILSADERSALALLKWLSAEAEALVRLPHVRRRIERLAGALLANTTMSAGDALAALEEV